MVPEHLILPCPGAAETSAHFPAPLPSMEAGGGRSPRPCQSRGGAAPVPRVPACSWFLAGCVPVETLCYTTCVTLGLSLDPAKPIYSGTSEATHAAWWVVLQVPRL